MLERPTAILEKQDSVCFCPEAAREPKDVPDPIPNDHFQSTDMRCPMAMSDDRARPLIDAPASEYGSLGDPCLILGSCKPNKLGRLPSRAPTKSPSPRAIKRPLKRG